MGEGFLPWFRLEATSGSLLPLGETAPLPEMGILGVLATRNLVFYRNPKDRLGSSSDGTLLAPHAGNLEFYPVHNINGVFAQSVVPALWRQRQLEKFKVVHCYLDEFKVILGYLRQNRPLWFPLWAPVSFNLRILALLFFGAPWGLCTCSQDSFVR